MLVNDALDDALFCPNLSIVVTALLVCLSVGWSVGWLLSGGFTRKRRSMYACSVLSHNNYINYICTCDKHNKKQKQNGEKKNVTTVRLPLELSWFNERKRLGLAILVTIRDRHHCLLTYLVKSSILLNSFLTAYVQHTRKVRFLRVQKITSVAFPSPTTFGYLLNWQFHPSIGWFLDTQDLTGLIVADRYPIGLSCTPLYLVDLPFGSRIGQYRIFNGSGHLLNVPDKRLMIISGSAYMTRAVIK